MKKEVFINESLGDTRIAIQEDNQLVEVYIEQEDKQRMVGNIYKGKVENVLPGMQAAFVDIGYDLNAFLPFSEIENNDYTPYAKYLMYNNSYTNYLSYMTGIKIKIPNEIIILDKIPKSSTGKLLRRELIQEVIRYAKYDDLEPIN